MQDVIFEGTDKRSAANICEVALLFTECEDQLGTAFHEIEIKRRVTREGGSDYFLNGKSCRLKDIQMLFMDTGIGRMAYSFLVQGQIDQILSTDPSERRLIFEEASGITKYKSQRHETLQKLQQATLNLTRLHDVLDPIEARVTILKQQVEKATLYQALHHRFQHLEWAFFAYQREELHKEILILKTALTPLAEALESQKIALQKLQQTITDLQENKALQQDILKSTQSRYQALQKTQAEWIQKETIAATQSTHAHERLMKLRNEMATLHQETEASRLNISQQAQEILPLKETLETTQAHYKTLEPQVKQVAARVLELERNLQSLKNKGHTFGQEKNRLSKIFTDQSIALKTLEAQIQHADQVHGNETLALTGLQEQITLTNQKIAAANAHQLAVQETLRGSKDKLTQKRHELQTLESELQKAISEQTTLTTELRLLEGWLNRFEGTSLSTQKALKGEIPNCPKGALGLLSEILEIPEAYAEVVEAALSVATDLLLPKDLAQMDALFAALCNPSAGPIALAWPIERSNDAIATPISGFLAFNSFIACQDTRWASWVHHFFRGCFLIDDLKEGLSFIRDNPDAAFDLLVTKQGHVLNSKGFLYTTRQNQNGILKKRAHLKVLQTQATTQDACVEKIKIQQKSLKEEFENLQKATDSDQQTLQQAQNAHQASLTEAKILQNELQKLLSHQARADHEKTQLIARHSQAAAALQVAEAKELQLDHDLEAHQDIFKKAESEWQSARHDQALIEHGLREAERGWNEARQKVALKDAALQHAQKALERLQHQAQTLAEEESRLQEKTVEYQQITEEAKQIVGPLTAELTDLELALKDANNALNMLDEAWQKAQHDHTLLLKSHHEHSLKHLDLSKKLTQNENQLQTLHEKTQAEEGIELAALNAEENLTKAFQSTPFALDSQVSQDPSLQGTYGDFIQSQVPDWKKIERYIKTLKQALKALGPVHLDAIQEHDQLIEKRKFLLTQKEDLDAAHQDLLEAMTQVNKISSDLFAATFAKIRQHFQNTFTQLFGGGHADIALENPDQLLESGIEIIACPPGTRLKNLSLLSGGQKTMTAVALLFSIYLVKPSPFCVLDELDAPLDDANIGRFTHLLRSFTEFSQFLVITHNKRTLNAADILYGVTMPEKGITQMVSLDLAELK